MTMSKFTVHLVPAIASVAASLTWHERARVATPKEMYSQISAMYLMEALRKADGVALVLGCTTTEVMFVAYRFIKEAEYAGAPEVSLYRPTEEQVEDWLLERIARS
jgi:hypothetical protein